MLEILLDTSFILPSLGIDTGEQTMLGLKKVNDYSGEVGIWCSRFSILESTWIGMKLEKQGNLNRILFERGIKSLYRGGRYLIIEEGPEIFTDAFKLASLGHRDMIDNLLYSISQRQDLKFLTLDAMFRDFLEKNGLGKNVILPEEI